MVIAATLIGAINIYSRRKRPVNFIWKALIPELLACILIWFQTQLADDGALITYQPLIIDLISDGMTVCDNPVGKFYACRSPINTLMTMSSV